MGCWRSTPPPPRISSADLDQVAPVIRDPHLAGLAWRRIQNTELQSWPSAQGLLQITRRTALRNAMVRAQIEEIFALLRAAGIEPILTKGWASARLYACPELRGYGDVDLVIRPGELAAARALLCGRTDVDLDHFEFASLSEIAIDDIFDHSQLVSINGSSIRVLGPEDHLSLLCRHFFRHLAAYPVGLCDVAAALESIPARFDWNRCLGTSTQQAHWVECGVKLAQDLLSARLEQPFSIPRWLVPAVLERWAAKPSPIRPVSQASNVLQASIDRWPSPLQATLLLGRRIDNTPRLPYQMLWFGRLAWRFVHRSVVLRRRQ